MTEEGYIYWIPGIRVGSSKMPIPENKHHPWVGVAYTVYCRPWWLIRPRVLGSVSDHKEGSDVGPEPCPMYPDKIVNPAVIASRKDQYLLNRGLMLLKGV